ncbi:DUF4129 domain-containing protein [[Eubacterium] cellulosolvens]
MSRKGYTLAALIILIILIGSFLPYVFLRESRHYPLSEAKERIKKLYPDFDGDLLNDNIEKNVTFTSPMDPDSDDDFFPDGAEFNYWNETFKKYNDDNYLPTGDIDNDGQSNILDYDSDSDGVPDGWEMENGLKPWHTDSDLDGYSDRFEFIIYYNFEIKPKTDLDNDKMPDYWENYFNITEPWADTDGDGISNIYEWLNGSDPTVRDERYGFDGSEDRTTDSDFDGLSDRLERAIGTQPFDDDSDSDGVPDAMEFESWSLPFNQDSDGDNLTDEEELYIGTSSYMNDSDMDKLSDFEELVTDPTVPDTNKNLVLDGDEVYADDIDRDGLPNLLELDDSDGFTTDPFNPDTDGDGIVDGREDADHDGTRDGNDPTDRKSDWGSGGETDPNDPDTDNGGEPDGFEVLFGRDPLNPEDDETELPEGPSIPAKEPPKGIYIDPKTCLTTIIIIVIIILILIVSYYLIYHKRRLIDEVIDILEAGERELYSLDTSDEIRNAIYRTYLAFQNALTKYDLRRIDSMTVQEFAAVVRNKLPIRPSPVNGLTNVFEEARYSDHVMGIPSKNRALRSFRQVRQDLMNYRDEYLKSKDVESDVKTGKKFLNMIKKTISLKETERDIPKNN